MKTKGFSYFKKYYLRRWQLYLLLVVPFIYIIIFAYIPMLGAQISFRDFTPAKGIWGSTWVGLKHFKRFFNYYNCWRLFTNTISISLYDLIVGFPLPIILALVLNAFPIQRFKKLVQTVSYMPHFISTVVLIGMIMQLFNPVSGAIGNLYYILKGERMADIFSSAAAFRHIYVWSGIWAGVGWGSIIYMAALSGIDPELHEAAKIDGASRIQQISYIDLPSILPTATIMLILRTGNILSVGFEKALLLQNDLNKNTSEIISTYVYKVGLSSPNNFSYGTAIGLMNSVINFIIIIAVNQIIKKMGETSLF